MEDPNCPCSCNGRAQKHQFAARFAASLEAIWSRASRRGEVGDLQAFFNVAIRFWLYRLSVIMILWDIIGNLRLVDALIIWTAWTGRALSELLIQSPHTVVMYRSLNHLSTSSMNPATQYYTFKSARLCANSDHKCTTKFQWTPRWNPRSAQIRTGSPVAMYHRCRDSAHWCRPVEVQSL